MSHEDEQTLGKFEPGDIVEAKPLVAFPGMDELLICQDEEPHRVGRIEDLRASR